MEKLLNQKPEMLRELFHKTQDMSTCQQDVRPEAEWKALDGMARGIRKGLPLP